MASPHKIILMISPNDLV